MAGKEKAADSFGGRLRHARNLRGWNQTTFAQKVGMPPSSVAHFEADSRKPSFESLARLANALEMTTDFLLGRVRQPEFSQQTDPIYERLSSLSGENREMAHAFLDFLARRQK